MVLTIGGVTLDSGWVQAIGSVAAIIVGFVYVALQNHWQAEAKRKEQKDFRRYTRDLVDQQMSYLGQTLATFQSANASGDCVLSNFRRDGSDIVADELLTVRPSDCGHASFTLLVRKVALHSKAFADIAAATASTVEPVSSDVVKQLTALRDNLKPTVEAIRLLV